MGKDYIKQFFEIDMELREKGIVIGQITPVHNEEDYIRGETYCHVDYLLIDLAKGMKKLEKCYETKAFRESWDDRSYYLWVENTLFRIADYRYEDEED